MPRRVIVLERREVICGADPGRLDFRADGASFDADICRAIAAALLDDPDAIDVRSLDLTAALAALEAGAIDAYVGPTDRDLPGIAIGPTLFVDATGAIARADVGIARLTDLRYATVCLIQDSIDEHLFDEAAAAARVTVQPFLFNPGDYDTMYKTYDQGRCDAVVDDRVRLAQRLATLSVPREHGLIDLTLIAGRRGLIAASSDANWAAIVAAIGNGLIRAEELGVSSSNLEASLAGDDPAIRRLLGVEGSVGADPGVTNDFVVRIITHIGNYGEIYDRHFVNLPRGPNALVEDGGQISAAGAD